MSFAYTPEEQARVRFANTVGHHLDPIGYKDLTLIIVIATIYGINLLAVLFMLWNHKYPPIKSKSPWLMASAYVSGIFWFVGDLQINLHIHLVGPILSNCKLLGVWFRLLMGVCTISSLIALRSYGLYRVFCLNLPYSGFGFYLPFMIYCACMVIYGVVIQCLSSRTTIVYVPYLEACFYPDGFKAALLAFIWITWLIVAFMNWKIRNIKSSFNESKEMAMACFVVFAVLIYNTVIEFALPYYPFSLKLRLLSTVLDHLAVNIVWWTIMGPALFSCLFYKESYLDYWKTKLRMDGLQKEYQLSESKTHSTIIGRMSHIVPGKNTNLGREEHLVQTRDLNTGNSMAAIATDSNPVRPDSPTVEKSLLMDAEHKNERFNFFNQFWPTKLNLSASNSGYSTPTTNKEPSASHALKLPEPTLSLSWRDRDEGNAQDRLPRSRQLI
ncbi:hypothetical protein GGI12_001116 [Dipsacomyces acuminosporus]|nr:hypothetical protein GGI12_001116 [Dipsacomyces acuminosporus]